MNEQVIRTEVRSAVDDRIPNYKFVLVNYFEKSKKYSVVLESKINGEINILQASGLCIKEVSDKLVEQYDWLLDTSNKTEKNLIADSVNA